MTENYPKLGSGTKYYPKLSSYVNEGGLCFDYTKEMKIEEIQGVLNTNIPMVGVCVFNDRNNNPIRYKKNGEPVKNQRQVIDGCDYEGTLVKFDGIDNSTWDNKEAEGVYFITFNGYIVKIGMTIDSFQGRFKSYCCGYRKTMSRKTPSTTNFIICEVCYAALLLGIEVNIYGIEIKKETKEIEQYDRKVTIPISIVRGHEEIITSIYKENVGHIPPLCVQHAKNVD